MWSKCSPPSTFLLFWTLLSTHKVPIKFFFPRGYKIWKYLQYLSHPSCFFNTFPIPPVFSIPFPSFLFWVSRDSFTSNRNGPKILFYCCRSVFKEKEPKWRKENNGLVQRGRDRTSFKDIERRKEREKRRDSERKRERIVMKECELASGLVSVGLTLEMNSRRKESNSRSSMKPLPTFNDPKKDGEKEREWESERERERKRRSKKNGWDHEE